MKQTKFVKQIEELLSWQRFYDKFDFKHLLVAERYVLSWFIEKLKMDLITQGHIIKLTSGVGYKSVQERILKEKDKEELEMYRKKYGDINERTKT